MTIFSILGHSEFGLSTAIWDYQHRRSLSALQT